MAENSFFKPKFYHHHNAIGMVVAMHQYESINTEQERAGISVRYGPPVINGRIETEDVNIHAATGIYIPEVYFSPIDKKPSLELEDAITELYRVREIEPKERTERTKTSAERTCK